MATTTTNMSLTKWGSPTDKFNYLELAENFDKIDLHDHSSGRGVQITTAGIAPGAINASVIAAGGIGSDQLASNSVTNAKVADNAIDTAELASGAVSYAKLGNTAKILTGTDATDAITSSSSQTTGQLIAIPNATNSGLWTFRWSGSTFSGGSGGWDFVGGSPASAYNESLSGFANNTNNYSEANYKTVYSGTSTTFGINLTYKGVYDIRGGIEYVADGSNSGKCYTGGYTGYGTGLSTYYVTNILRNVVQYVTYSATASAAGENICGFTSSFNGVHSITSTSQTVRLWHRPREGGGGYYGTDSTVVSSASLQIVPVKIYV